jgi:hypothetical protein
MKKNLLDRSSSREIKSESERCSNFKNNKIVIALDLGTVNGKIYLTGFPQYDDKTKEIYFDELDYVLTLK